LQPNITDTKKILLVEDNLVNCEVAIDMLEPIDIDVDVANNGQQALDLYNKNQYALILMDCEMPIMDGYTATRHIRTKESKLKAASVKCKHVPIIALTAHVMANTKEKCITIGMDDFLGKPFSLPELQSMLSKWLYKQADVSLGSTENSQSSQILSQSPSYPISLDKMNIDWQVLNYDIINKFYLKQINDGSNILINIINIYIDQTADLMSKLTTAAQNKDVEAMRLVSHTLKSSSHNIGALMLADLCRNVELGCVNSNIDEHSLTQIYQNYTTVDKALKLILTNING